MKGLRMLLEDRPSCFSECIPMIEKSVGVVTHGRGIGFLSFEDLLQEGLIRGWKAWQNWQKQKCTCAFGTYLYQVVRQHILDMIRRYGNRIRGSVESECAWESSLRSERLYDYARMKRGESIREPWEELSNVELSGMILGMASKLDKKFNRRGKRVKVLKEIMRGKNLREVSEKLGMGEGRVSQIVNEMRSRAVFLRRAG